MLMFTYSFAHSLMRTSKI